MLSCIEDIASTVQFQTSSGVVSTSANKTSIEDSSYIEYRETYCPPRKRFKATSASSHFNSYFSNYMETYTSEQFHTYNPDADLDDSILKKSPVPRKLPGSATLEDYLKGLLEKK